MGNANVKEGEENLKKEEQEEVPARSETGGTMVLSSSMMLESPVPAHYEEEDEVAHDSVMSSTPPGSYPSLIIPQMPQVPLSHAHEVGVPWNSQLTHRINDRAPQSPTIPTLIEWKHGGDNVYVEGSWDNWSTRLALQRSGKDFVLLKFLPAGVYHYKFLVSGEWRYSPDLPCILEDNGGGVNVLHAQGYVPENLDGMTEFELPSSPDASYESLFPGPEDYTKDPPLLPSQLYLNTQLESLHLMGSAVVAEGPVNSIIDSSNRPQHVVLNHLFVETRKAAGASAPALALGFTQRFRAKYVTVILHKPLRKS